MTPEELDRMIRPVLLKDLRIQCRARGISPAGGLDALRARLKEAMMETQDFTMKDEAGNNLLVDATAGTTTADIVHGTAKNNYTRPNGQQNVGNVLTDRASSRVLAPPGGGSSIVFGDTSNAPDATSPGKAAAAAVPKHVRTVAAAPAAETEADARPNNNYSRAEGQNVGNFLTGRNSSRVLAPPGGASQITFG